MSDKKVYLWRLAFIMIGILIGALIEPSFYHTADEMINTCNHNYGTGNWNVTKKNEKWICTPLYAIDLKEIDLTKYANRTGT